MTTTTTTTAGIHRFESAGLGKAPFTYIGEQFQNLAHGQRVLGNVGGCELTTKPGGTCQYCGTAILNLFTVESADGKRFIVGSECVLKTGDKGIIRKVQDAVKKNTAQRRIERGNAAALKLGIRIQAAADRIGEAQGLKGKPHPNASMARDGMTLFNYVEWLLKNGGTSGRTRAAAMIEESIKQQ